MKRIGSSSASSTSPAAIEVSGTSAVGMHHRSSRSMAYASSANLGSWPLAVNVAVLTRLGGRISSKASALRSSASWHSARESVAPCLRSMTNIAPVILVARSVSRIPSAAPVSQCGTRWCSAKPSRSPTTRSVGLSASVAPSGESGWISFGIRSRRSWSSSATSVSSPTSSCSRAPSSRLAAAAASAAAASPEPRSRPTSRDRSLIWLRTPSRSVARARRRVSRSSTASMSEGSRPRRTSDAFTTSGSVRMRRMSSTVAR